MHITATCPACHSQYQVDPNLRGKRMRCPNTICRTVFEVTDGASVAAPPMPVQEPVAVAAKKPVPAPPPPVAEPAKPKWAAPPPVRAAVVPSIPPPPIDDFDIPGDDADVGRVSDPSESIPAKIPNVQVAPPPKTKPRHPFLYIAAALLAVAVVATVIAVRFNSQKQLAEAGLFAKAQELYQARDFGEAMKRFQRLQSDYPDSPNVASYRLLATLSELRVEVDAANDPAALADARKHAVEFLDSFEDAPAFKGHEGELFEAILQLTERSRRSVQETLDATALAEIETMWNRFRPLANQDVRKQDDELRRSFADVRTSIELRDRRLRVLNAFTDAPPTAAAIVDMRRRSADAKLAYDPEIVAALAKLRDRHKASLVFVPPGDSAPKTPGDAFEASPLVSSPKFETARGDDVVVSLAPSGVLYGIRAKDSSLMWAHRLGIDSRLEPLRLENSPAVVAVSNDAKFIARIDSTTGKFTWRQNLPTSVAVAPFVAGGRLLVPLVTGRVEVLDPANGKLDGSYQLDQPLAAAGTSHPGTSLVTLPGAAHCLYVFDLANRTCVAVMETDHVAGSLIAPPIVASGGEKQAWIVLTQAEPGPKIRLRPIAFPPGKSRPERDVVVAGTLGFPPRHDAESILLATDEGKLHRIGLRLPGNNDPLLFPLTPAEVVLDGSAPTARAQVIHVDAENVWVTSGGRFQRLQQSFSPTAGPTIKLRWPSGIPLGEPLNAPHVHVDAAGTILFLTTHDPRSPSPLLSAVDGETGKIFWQAWLGSIPRGEPLVVGDEIVWDDGIALFRRGRSQTGIRSMPTAAAPRSALFEADKKILRAGWWPEQAKLIVADVTNDGGTPREVKLPSPVAGRPVLLDDGLIVPLKSGMLVRVDLANGSIATGPDWRTPGGDGKFPYLVRLRPNRFIVSKGNGLVAYEWGKSWKEIARYQPADRVLTGRAFHVGDKLLAADNAGSLALLDDERLLPIARKDWSLKGKLTAGPFAIGANVLMVVDGKRLVALDPTRDGLLWDVAMPSEIAVAPRLLGDRLVVADLSGNFWTLDPATGANLTPDDRPALSVRANIAPAASPIVLPDGKLLAIWSDGTAGVVEIR